uniref:Cytochrome c oxidase subunit 3 n=1 Tax=Calophya californica TaxID=2047826 RepID=A0A343LDP8_9HEMI|nr:cytochrome c oxidase subunit III [Calophya californica]ATN42473.1 cytochrome c oxidase subunit 3 [Calophya californica]
MMKNHSFHLVDPSPWPIVISFQMMNCALSGLIFLNNKNSAFLYVSLILISLIMMLWWRDIQRESTFQGNHTFSVLTSMKYGMLLFISSEVFFFISFFWSFFHHSLSPNIEMGMNWPPQAIQSFNPLTIPLLNTLILLSSGISVTWSHASLCSNSLTQTKISLLITCILGLYFSLLQMYEYYSAPFCVSDSVYGNTFFITTGFHGLHVIIGTIFLIISALRVTKMHFSSNHHFGMEAAIWYWHFVDVVWLFLYMTMYWWGK